MPRKSVGWGYQNMKLVVRAGEGTGDFTVWGRQPKPKSLSDGEGRGEIRLKESRSSC